MIAQCGHLHAKSCLPGVTLRSLSTRETKHPPDVVPAAFDTAPGHHLRDVNPTRAEELLRKLQPPGAFGVPRALAIYHWLLREFDATADWFEKAIGQHDPYVVVYLRNWYGRELRSTPRWTALMRKLNLPEL
jgi:hypothetical protein